MEDLATQIIVRKFVEKWIDDNPQLGEDIEELAGKIAAFNLMWGTEFYLAHRPIRSEEVKPRDGKE